MRLVLAALLAGLLGGPATAGEQTPASPAPSPIASPAAPSPASPPAPRATLADVAWIAGHWREEKGATVSEEVWAPPVGNSMIGMWRLVAMGEARVFELLTLTQEEGSLVLRLRHFDPKLVAWTAEKELPLSLPLVRVGPGEAAFEGREPSGWVRLTYTRSGTDGLTIKLEKQGKPAQFFSFHRSRSG